jgi:hypothetical protein
MKSYTKEQERIIDEVTLRLAGYGLCPDDLYPSASNGSKPLVSGALPTLEDAWNAGVEEGSTRAGHFDWGIRYKNIEFAQWYAAELEYRSLGQ